MTTAELIEKLERADGFVWDTDRLEQAFRKVSERHGFLESLIAVAAEGVRIRVEFALKAKEADNA